LVVGVACLRGLCRVRDDGNANSEQERTNDENGEDRE
jgi:hypothetical protein